MRERYELHCTRCGQVFMSSDAGWTHYRSCPGLVQASLPRGLTNVDSPPTVMVPAREMVEGDL